MDRWMDRLDRLDAQALGSCLWLCRRFQKLSQHDHQLSKPPSHTLVERVTTLTSPTTTSPNHTTTGLPPPLEELVTPHGLQRRPSAISDVSLGGSGSQLPTPVGPPGTGVDMRWALASSVAGGAAAGGGKSGGVLSSSLGGSAGTSGGGGGGVGGSASSHAASSVLSAPAFPPRDGGGSGELRPRADSLVSCDGSAVTRRRGVPSVVAGQSWKCLQGTCMHACVRA
jgi:hypothetical protein